MGLIKGTFLEYSGYKWIMRNAAARIEELHLQLEAPGVDHDTTNVLRGKIQDTREWVADAQRAYQSSGEEVGLDLDLHD